MQRRGRGMDDFFGGDPFGGNPFGSFRGFGRPGSLISSFFGGRDPFDDPFFTRPFGNMMGPSLFGSSMLGPSIFEEPRHAGFIEEQPPQSTKSKGPIIKELTSDEEEETEDAKDKNDNPRKHSRSGIGPYVHEPDEEAEGFGGIYHGEKKSRHAQYSNDFHTSGLVQPQSYTFHSSTVTYGGPNGAYYTSSTTRRNGGDGVMVEESKEADSTTGKATHRLSRGIHDKGHSLTRKLNSDGRVNTMQTLHNLNEDELAGFNDAWKGKAKQHLPGWKEGFDMLDNGGGSSRYNEQQPSRGWALPSAEHQNESGRVRPDRANRNRRE